MAVLKIWDGSQWVWAQQPSATPYVRLSSNVDQTITANTDTLITYDTKVTYGAAGWAPLALFPSTARGVQPNLPGIYEINGSVTFRPPASSGRTRLTIQKNGVDLFAGGIANAAIDVVAGSFFITDIHPLLATDVITMILWQTSPGNPNGTCFGNPLSTFLSVMRVGSTGT